MDEDEEQRQREEELMKMKILRHKKDEVELAGSKRNDDVVVREVEEKEEEVEDSEGHSSDEGNMSDVWNSGDSEREESGNEEQEVQGQKENDLLFEREMRGKKEGKEKAATRARREELKGWKRISVNIGKVNDKGVWVECKENVHHLRVRQRPFGGRKGETVTIWRGMWEKRKVKAIAVTRVDVDEGNWGW
ncbi:hypothetical protein KUCAC02_005542 [Chaenocephalus aceratus]|uniref:Uncharacterized protein n=1 Tax=Chaenocephalus aceratus TaxID=36190 RepID=A0ACB9WP60_CHAAC|nr:hypothetical protein KUCAC02_005542 [Chaenocephalus aceratus]